MYAQHVFVSIMFDTHPRDAQPVEIIFFCAVQDWRTALDIAKQHGQTTWHVQIEAQGRGRAVIEQQDYHWRRVVM